MFVASLVGMEAWYSTRCRLIWKMKVTKYGRLYFQLAPSTLPIDVTGFGLLPTVQTQGLKVSDANGKTQFVNLLMLPTPNTMDALPPKSDKAHEREMTINRPGRRQCANIRDVVVRQPHLIPTQNKGLLPTPTVMDTNCGDLEKIDQRRAKAKQTSKNGNGFGVTLGELANRELLPTPAAQDAKNNTLPLSQALRDSVPGAVMRQFQTGTTSQLNPLFVGEMMGFPVDWLELPFRATDETV